MGEAYNQYTDTACSSQDERWRVKVGTPVQTETNDPPKMYGWVCPVCGRGLSPYTNVCPCKGWDKGWKITC